MSEQNRDREGAVSRAVAGPGPLAYLLTFRCYGTWLHGDARGSVDRAHRAYGEPLAPPNAGLEQAEQRRLRHPPITLDAERRAVVAQTIGEVAAQRGWTLHALNVRTNHVHLVVSLAGDPERALITLKAWATRRMVAAGLLPAGTRLWSRHGSSRYLWTPASLEAACHYVRDGQGADLPQPRTAADRWQSEATN